jgi:all-trans-8'-apo-beta-carotenal 15,15'-oxygenase
MLEWRSGEKNRFYLVDKESGKFVQAEILSKEAFFYYHVLNSYEQDDQLVIDVFCMPNFSLVEDQSIANIRAGHKAKDEHSPRLFRYVIPTKSVTDLRNCPENSNLVTIKTTATAMRIENKIFLQPELLSQTPMEFSAFNKNFIGKSLRYVWASGAFAPSPHQHKIFKFDMQTRKSISWEAAEHQFVGEPIFVPKYSNGSSEDEGIIILVVVNYIEKEGEKDFVIFLNPANLEELGRAYFNTEIPIALHSVYLPLTESNLHVPL